jgi:predicted Zn-dependent protease
LIVFSQYPTCFEYETAARSVIVEYPRLSMNASIQVRNANKETDPKAVQNVAKLWPHSSAVQFEVAYILAQAKFPDLAVEILKTGLSESPDNFGMWRLLTEIPTVSDEEKAEARLQMKRLDPLNPNLK